MNHPRQRRLAALILAAATLGCAAEPELQFADWILPVPEGTPITENAPVAREDRDPDAIRLIEDLVIGGEPDSMFYATPQIAVAEDGTIYVLDRDDYSVRMFDARGALVRKFGRQGEGPGEMDAARGITIAGNHLLIADGLISSRILAYTLDGEPVETLQTRSNFGLHFYGLPDGTFVNSSGVTVEDRSLRRVAGRYSRQGEELHRYLDLEGTPPPEIPTTRDMNKLMAEAVQSSVEAFVVRPAGLLTNGATVYAVLADQYEVLALDLEGVPQWALRVAWPRPPFPEFMKESARRRAERYETDPETLEFPAFGVAVNSATIDGRGRIFVRPNPGDQPEDDPYAPVDVYSPDGDFIAAGLGQETWIAAQGDYVYSRRHDEDTDNWYVVRSRLLVNGQ